MNVFESVSVYDSECGEWVEYYKINGQEVESEEYFERMETETEEDECDYCECCECCDEVEEEPEEIELVCDGECEECDVPNEICRDISIVEEFADEFKSMECLCEACLRNFIYDVLTVGKEIGWNDHVELMKRILDE